MNAAATDVRAVQHYAGLLAAFRARLAELDVSYGEIEAAARLPERYLAKVVCSPPKRLIHPYTLFNIIAALRLQMQLVPDLSAQPAFRRRRRKVMLSRPSNVTFTPDQMRMNGIKGGHARVRRLSAARRRAIARKAARARWRREMIGGLGK